MSLDELESDVARNTEDFSAQTLPFASFEDVKKYFETTIWPVLANVVEEIKEIDSDLSDLVYQADSVLQPEEAGIFAAIIQQCRGLVKVLGTRLKPNDPNDKKLALRLKNVLTLCQKAEETLLEITVTPSPEDIEDAPVGGEEPDAANSNEGAADDDAV